MSWLEILKQIDDYRWELPQDYKPGMRVPALIFADRAMIEQMGDRNLILLRGHGAAVVGKSVEEATSLAIEFERLAKIMYLATVTGRPLIELAPEDVARYDPGNPDRRPFGRERRQSDELAAAADRGGWTRYINNLERTGVR